jgi:hypothetical protein
MARSETVAALLAWTLAAGDADAVAARLEAAALGAPVLGAPVLVPLEHEATNKPIAAALAAVIV